MSAISTKFATRRNAVSTVIFALVASFSLHSLGAADGVDPGMNFANGKEIYRFYCYQCHGYSGDAKTLSSTYLDPKPRNFTASSRESLPIDRMLEAVRNGRPGTAMVSFRSTLTTDEIQSVVWYIRDSLLGNSDADQQYHSTENGWQNHDRYSAAFPFIDGSISLDTSSDELSASQIRGRNLFLSACISCHDQPNSSAGEAIWETRAVSFPRRHYSHREKPLDVVSGASPYARHEVSIKPENMTSQQAFGMQLYLDNCAFCHAPDGTGKNWIGSFLEPKPRDFTADEFTLHRSPVAFREIIRSGIPGTSMPAWRHVLSDAQIDAIGVYIGIAFVQ